MSVPAAFHLDYGQTPNLGIRPTKIPEASLETERSDDGGRQGHRPEIVSAIRAAEALLQINVVGFSENSFTALNGDALA